MHVHGGAAAHVCMVTAEWTAGSHLAGIRVCTRGRHADDTRACVGGGAVGRGAHGPTLASSSTPTRFLPAAFSWTSAPLPTNCTVPGPSNPSTVTRSPTLNFGMAALAAPVGVLRVLRRRRHVFAQRAQHRSVCPQVSLDCALRCSTGLVFAFVWGANAPLAVGRTPATELALIMVQWAWHNASIPMPQTPEAHSQPIKRGTCTACDPLTCRTTPYPFLGASQHCMQALPPPRAGGL